MREVLGARRWRLLLVLAMLLLAFGKWLIVTAWIHAAPALGFAGHVTATAVEAGRGSGKWYMWWPFPVFIGPVVDFRVGLTGALLRRLPEVPAIVAIPTRLPLAFERDVA